MGALWALLAFPGSPKAASAIAVPRISVDEVKQVLGNKNVVVVDVRKDRAYWSSDQKILNAKREDPSRVTQWAQKYHKDMTLVFYCA